MKPHGYLALLLVLVLPGFSKATEVGNTLFVFIGEKISLEKMDPGYSANGVIYYNGFSGRYKVIKTIFGESPGKEIEFKAYDLYGIPAFSKYKNVMLFLSMDGGKYFHELYQYFEVFKTKGNRWATCGDPYKYDEYHRKNLKPQKIEFLEPVYYDVSGFPKDYIQSAFSENYFLVKDGKAICRGLGNYVEELFEVKKEGVLKARGLF